MQHVGEEGVFWGKVGGFGEIFWSGQAREEVVFDFGFWSGFLAVAIGLVGGPVGDRGGGMGEVDDEVAAFFPADGVGPPHFEEVAGTGMIVGGEVDAAVEVGEELGGAGAVGVPSSEDFLTIFDAEVGEAGEFIGVEKGRVLEAELLDGTQEDEVGGTGAEGFPGGFGILADGAVFQSHAGGKAVDGSLGGFVASSIGHGFDGGEDVLIELAGWGDCLGAGGKGTCEEGEDDGEVILKLFHRIG